MSNAAPSKANRQPPAGFGQNNAKPGSKEQTKNDGNSKKQDVWVIDPNDEQKQNGESGDKQQADRKRANDPGRSMNEQKNGRRKPEEESRPPARDLDDSPRGDGRRQNEWPTAETVRGTGRQAANDNNGAATNNGLDLATTTRSVDRPKPEMNEHAVTGRTGPGPTQRSPRNRPEEADDSDDEMSIGDDVRGAGRGRGKRNGPPVAETGGGPGPKQSDASPRPRATRQDQPEPEGRKPQQSSDDGEEERERVRKPSTFTGKSTLNSTTDTDADPDNGDTYESVNVVLRVRPLSSQENQRRDKNIFSFPGDGAIWVEQPGGATKSFTYNMTFEPNATQEDVFENCGIKKIVEMAVNGYSCTAFAFGQTGSGKTYTITGPPDQILRDTHGTVDAEYKGLIPRSFYYLFYLMHRKPNAGYRLTASYLEIYNEQVIDLLNPSQRTHLPVRWSRHKGFYVENLFNVECESIEDLFAILDEGLRNRATGSNSINEHSSRSHAVLTLHIDSEVTDEEDDKLVITKHGKLTFVDLAGSEKTKTDMATNQSQVLESNNINRSLLVLGNCISALSDPKRRQGHVPYRDSKLTKLLADSLRGNAVTLMIACVSPSSFNSAESMNTLRYANRAKRVKSKPVIVMDPREKLIVSLKREIKILRSENHYLRTQLDFPVKPKGQLQKENDSKFLQMLKDQKRDGKVTEVGLYEMLQEYMIENEMLRKENTELFQSREAGRNEQQALSRENEKLTKKLEILLKGGTIRQSPITIYSSDTQSINSFDSSASTTPIQSSSGSRGGQTQGRWGGAGDDWKPTNAAASRGKPVQAKKPPHHLPNAMGKNPDSGQNGQNTGREQQLRPARSIDSLDLNGGPAGAAAANVRRSFGNSDDFVDAEDDDLPRGPTKPSNELMRVDEDVANNDPYRKVYNKDYTADVVEMNRQLKQELLLLDREIQNSSSSSPSTSPGTVPFKPAAAATTSPPRRKLPANQTLAPAKQIRVYR